MTKFKNAMHEEWHKSRKFCVDCKWMRDDERCQHYVYTSIVDGEIWPMLCDVARATGGECGPDGKLWEAK